MPSETLNQNSDANIIYGPLAESTFLSSGLDYYKLTMSQLGFNKLKDVEVTYTFHNRGEQRLLDYIDPASLQARFDQIKQNGFSETELEYFAAQTNSLGDPVFSREYIEHLRTSELPTVNVSYNPEIDDIEPTVSGPHSKSTIWETVVLSEVNEAYFAGMIKAKGLDINELYNEGKKRLDSKIDYLKQHPEIKIAEFGARRHFSLRQHLYVLSRIESECPENLIGTSDVGLAMSTGLKPVGTYAHELDMIYAARADAKNYGLAGIARSHSDALNDWQEQYQPDLMTALADSFGSDFFFNNFTKEQAEAWSGVRQDSGDPIAFGEKLIKFYQDNGIDPKSKTMIPSDGLNIEEIDRIYKHFEGRIKLAFGWGTDLTNDLGLKPLNIVMKATKVLYIPSGAVAETVKLSDDPGKHTGSDENVARYILMKEMSDGKTKSYNRLCA